MANTAKNIAFIKKGNTNYQVQPIYRDPTTCNIQNKSQATVSISISPNIYYNLGTITAGTLAITLTGIVGTNINNVNSNTTLQEYMFEFTIGTTLYGSKSTLSLTISPAISWHINSTIPSVKGKRYQVSILNGLALCVSI